MPAAASVKLTARTSLRHPQLEPWWTSGGQPWA